MSQKVSVFDKLSNGTTLTKMHIVSYKILAFEVLTSIAQKSKEISMQSFSNLAPDHMGEVSASLKKIEFSISNLSR